MGKLRIAVIGLGMGRNHVTGFRRHPAAEVVAAADTDASRLEKIGKELELPHLYQDPLEMLRKEKPDIVSIAVPNLYHKPLTLAALAAGCHVLCEKPMAMNAVEATEMMQAAQQAGKQLGINFSYRFSPQSFAMKKLVDAGKLGEIYHARSEWLRRRGMPGFGGWFGTKSLAGGGPLIDLGVHRLDLALWLMGYPEPAWVMGNAVNRIAGPLAEKQGKKFDVEDFACGFIRFHNGATLELEASWATNVGERELMSTRLLGTRGGLLQRNLGEGYEFEVKFFHEEAGCQFDTTLHPPVPECHDSYWSFVDAVAAERPFEVEPRQGVIVMKLLDAIYQSAATGEPVAID